MKETGAIGHGPADKPYAEEWIREARALPRCEWCGGTGDKMPRVGLCRPCNNVRKRLIKTQRWVTAEKPAANRQIRFLLDRELAIVKNMQRLCEADGHRVHGLLNGEVRPLQLEGWFNDIAARIAKKPRLYSTAEQLGWSFTPPQRQLLAYLFWQIFHVHWQLNRKNYAEVLYSTEVRRAEQRQRKTSRG